MKYMLMICRDEEVALTPREGGTGRATGARIAETDGRWARRPGTRRPRSGRSR